MYVLAYYGIKPPEGSSSIVSTMGGALAGILAQAYRQQRAPGDERSRASDADPLKVEVANESDNPVPVEPGDGGTQ